MRTAMAMGRSLGLRDEALRMLHGDSKILEVARDASRVLRETRIDGAVIGGVAVVLHGYVRTTIDVDVFVPERAADFAAAITREGFRFDRSRREFVKGDVPIHIVTLDQLGSPPLRRKTIDNVLTVSLGDLITMKLRSGSRSVLRSIDLADVIGLIRAHRLTSTFAGRIDKSVRAEFRTLVRAVRSGG